MQEPYLFKSLALNSRDFNTASFELPGKLAINSKPSCPRKESVPIDLPFERFFAGMSPPKNASTPLPSDENIAAPGSPESQTPSNQIEADDSVSDEGYAESVSTSYVLSIATDIRRGIEENGRLYAAYGQHKPWVPVDDAEVG